MAKRKIKLDTEQRPFILVYQDFLESDLLENPYQVITYICLKKFANSKGQCYPSIKSLAKLTKMGVTKVKKTLLELEEKKVINIESRTRADGGKSSNLYTLYDFKELWNAKSVEEVETAKKNNFVNLSEVSTEMLLAEIERRNKEKVPETTTPTKVEVESSTNNNKLIHQKNQFNNTTTINKSQTVSSISEEESQEIEVERYTHEQIKEIYEYNVMVYDEPTKQSDIDTVIEILHSALNTTKPTIRIEGQAKSTKIVISKLLKLDKDCLLYAIDKFKEQTGRIKNPTSYMLTLLYNSKEQMNLDTANRVQYDMYNSAIADNGISSNCDTQKYDLAEKELTILQEETIEQVKVTELKEENYSSWTEQAKEKLERLKQKYPNL